MQFWRLKFALNVYSWVDTSQSLNIAFASQQGLRGRWAKYYSWLFLNMHSRYTDTQRDNIDFLLLKSSILTSILCLSVTHKYCDDYLTHFQWSDRAEIRQVDWSSMTMTSIKFFSRYKRGHTRSTKAHFHRAESVIWFNFTERCNCNELIENWYYGRNIFLK